MSVFITFAAALLIFGAVIAIHVRKPVFWHATTPWTV